MTSVSDLLLEYYLISTDLVEATPNPSKDVIKSNYSLVKDMVINDSYIPLFSIDKIKFVKNLNNVYEQLKNKAVEILKELGVETKLPPSYNVAIALQLSMVETWRRVVIDKIVFNKRVTIVKDSLDISPYTLLFLYRFIILSKFSGTGNEMVKLLYQILEDSKNREILSETYSEIKKVVEYATSDEMKRNKGRQRKAYTMFNTLYAPLMLSYVLNGAGLIRYYNAGLNKLAYAATSLIDVLGSYSFRVIYGYSQPALISFAEELTEYFKVIHTVLSSKDFKQILKEGSLYSYLVSRAEEHKINDMSKISIIWDLINNIIISALVSLELCKDDPSCKDVIQVYKDKVGDITIYEYVTRQYGLTY